MYWGNALLGLSRAEMVRNTCFYIKYSLVQSSMVQSRLLHLSDTVNSNMINSEGNPGKFVILVVQ